ncbi:MAG: twin-arginine translocation signal domain-containing protein [bacterium]
MTERMNRRKFLARSAAVGVGLAVGRFVPPAWAATPARKNVGDVLRFSTRPQGWRGLFGFVTFRLHAAFFDGQRVYYIRTDASDQAFAQARGLVFVPKLALALRGEATADYYLFSGGASGQLPVVSTAPGRDDFTPAFRVHRVTWKSRPRLVQSAEAVRDAESAGQVQVEATGVVVNYPVVRWPDGQMPVDRQRTEYLGPGQLLQDPDVERREVTFKLHQCFPNHWYIVTDTSAVPMAPMMKVAASPKTGALTALGATAKILVFGSGIRGPGPMGFQPSVFDSNPGDAIWSPFWDHYTFTWKDGVRPRVLRSEAEIVTEERAGRLRRWPGTPDTKGELFVVNCPAPVTGPPTWRA